MNKTIASEKPLDLNEWVYTVLKQRIMNNQYASSTQLRVDLLSEELQVSRTPIREALLRLKMDGLVRAESRVGFFVQEISRKDFEELFELRSLIECYAAEKAAKRITEEDIARLNEIQKLSKEAVERKDYEHFNNCETRIHDLIISYLNNIRITNTLDNVRDSIYRQRVYSIKDVYNVEQSLIEHQSIIASIQSRNPERAHEVMQTHLKNVEQRLLEFLDD